MANDEETVHYLWHLEAIGLLKCSGKTCEATERWKNALERDKAVNVAIIDNGLTRKHPNLDCKAIVSRIDFSTTSHGTRYLSDDGTSPEEYCEGRIETLRSLLTSPDGPIYAHVSDDLKGAIGILLSDGRLTPEQVPVRDPSHLFGSHGTSSAGLVAGTFGAETLAANKRALPYFGVDPKAQLISISTLYNHEYWPVIMGLLYAYAAGAHVILIPRPVMDLDDTLSVETGKGIEAVPFEDRPPPEGVDDLRATRFTDPASREYRILEFEKELFETVLSWISEKIPVVVAAGNSGRNRLEYPASLVQNKAPHLIVAGACTAYGRRASYSCHLDSDRDPGPGPTRHVLHAPSNDGEVVNNDYTRFDALTWRGRALLGPEDEEDKYSPYGILALDIPGEFGYGDDDGKGLDQIGYGQSGDEPIYSERSLYAIFGGTSAAAAITAGLVSLMQRARGDAYLDGQTAKRLLWDYAQPFWNVVSGPRPAPFDEKAREPRYPPGSAMIDADAVLKGLTDPDHAESKGKAVKRAKPAPD